MSRRSCAVLPPPSGRGAPVLPLVVAALTRRVSDHARRAEIVADLDVRQAVGIATYGDVLRVDLEADPIARPETDRDPGEDLAQELYDVSMYGTQLDALEAVLPRLRPSTRSRVVLAALEAAELARLVLDDLEAAKAARTAQS